MLAELDASLQSFAQQELAQLGKTRVAAAFLAQVLENTYTALETLFLRISQLFENSILTDKWHADLLDKMTLHIPDVRERVISDKTHGLLLELMRFRHFKRYYFELDYDWSKLDYLWGVYKRALPLAQQDLDRFTDYLKRLQAD